MQIFMIWVVFIYFSYYQILIHRPFAYSFLRVRSILFGCAPCSMQDLSSTTRGQTCALAKPFPLESFPFEYQYSNRGPLQNRFLVLYISQFLVLLYLLIYFWLCWVFVAALRLFSSCGDWGLLCVVVQGLLIVAVSLVVDHGL